MSISVSALYRYPIKSCAGTALSTAEIGKRGIEHDRRWMIVDDSNEGLTQRDIPQMALVYPHVDGNGGLALEAPGMPVCHAPAISIGQEKKVRVWDDWCSAIDQGDEVAAWLSDYLGQSCRLVRMADFTVRRLDEGYSKTGQVGFADGFPFLLISEASLADLNARLAEPVPINRFRPNIVVAGAESYAEDGWNAIRIGTLEFRIVKPCARCVIITVDQSTGNKGTEPLKTLATYRRSDGGVMFGQNLVHAASGQIDVGDTVQVLQ